MKHKLIKYPQSEELVVFFLGWSCDPSSVLCYTVTGRDYLILYDYRTLEIEHEVIDIIASYKTRTLIAHSFGVWVAGQLMHSLPKLVSATAYCGSLRPVDDTYGIPHRIFALTVRSIQREGIGKFNQRMCGGFTNGFNPSQTPFEEQYEELVALGKYFEQNSVSDPTFWDEAVICGNDQIFPPSALHRYWEDNGVAVRVIEAFPHFPFHLLG